MTPRRGAARSVRAHALVRAQMPVLRFQFPPAEIGAAARRLHRCLDSRLRQRTAVDSAGRTIDTVFFGGGTPSLFAPEEFARLLAALRQRIAFAADAEITLEANPGTVERGRFAGYRDAGINRVSLGAQSFAPQRARAPGPHPHGRGHAPRGRGAARAPGIDNFNLDLMYALPEQTLEQAARRCAHRLSLATRAHLATISSRSSPAPYFTARPPPLPDEDAAWAIQTECQRMLAAEGFEQYEVSAYAKPGAALPAQSQLLAVRRLCGLRCGRSRKAHRSRCPSAS